MIKFGDAILFSAAAPTDLLITLNWYTYFLKLILTEEPNYFLTLETNASENFQVCVCYLQYCFRKFFKTLNGFFKNLGTITSIGKLQTFFKENSNKAK